MSSFFDELGAAAKQTAYKVNIQISVAAQEQKLRESYQALGQLAYRMARAGQTPGGREFEAAAARIDEIQRRIRDLKSRACSPDDYAAAD